MNWNNSRDMYLMQILTKWKDNSYYNDIENHIISILKTKIFYYQDLKRKEIL